MKLNLDAMRTEIREHLESQGIAVFYGVPRGSDHVAAVYWDSHGHPDHREFLAAAQAAGVRLLTIFANEFSEEVIEDALERLEQSVLPRDERRSIEVKLREIRAYAGFTCQLELSFDIGPRVYICDLRTEWFDDLNEILDRVDEALDDQQEDDEERLGGGYFSNN